MCTLWIIAFNAFPAYSTAKPVFNNYPISFFYAAGFGFFIPDFFYCSHNFMLLMEKHSLQFAFFSEAAFVLCCSIIVYALLRSRPECLHTQPIGIINSESDRSNQKYASKTAGRSLYLYMLAGIFLFGMIFRQINSPEKAFPFINRFSAFPNRQE